jgi:hypothetical protein
VIAARLISPLWLDRYSRMDLRTSRDGPYVLGTVRESLRTARRLDRGDTVVFNPEERKFAWGVTSPRDLAKLRFFLRDGFGPLAHYGVHDIRMREPVASLVVPILEPRPTRLTLHMDARSSAWITFMVLFRGDNAVELRCEKVGEALPRILRVELSRATAGS